MASVTCPTCGNDNPDFLDNCQFCQTALRREATLNIGENPTKKSTGELEPILPDWLRDARQQARDSAEEEAAKEATKPKLEKAEPPDLLAGLAFHSASDDEEVPDWLAAINPVKDTIPSITPAKPAEEAPLDFFAQFNQPVAEPAKPVADEPQDETPAWMRGIANESQSDELSGWLSQPSAQSPVGESFDFNSVAPQAEPDWMSNLNAPVSQEPSAPTASDDLGWLRDLEASSKPAATPEPPQADLGWMPPTSSGAQEDLSWLNNLGGTPAPEQQPASSAQEDLGWLNNLGGEPAPSQPVPAQDDLGWLNNLGGLPLSNESAPSQPAPAQEDMGWLNNLGGEPVSSQPVHAQEDLSWLNTLGGTSEPTQPAPVQQEDLGWLNNLGDEPVSSQPAPVQEDLSWLNTLGGTPEPAQPTPSQQEDLGWLNNLGGESVSSQPAPAQDDMSWLNTMSAAPEPAQTKQPDWLQNLDQQSQPPAVLMSPARTAPLNEDAVSEMPDWLKSATEAPSMPPLGAAASSDWLASKTQPVDDIPIQFGDAMPVPTHSEPAPVDQSFFPASSDSSISSQDVDSLFNVDMPDWLSQQPKSAAEPSTPTGMTPAQASGALSPVDLPSWVQAMRPVESVIAESSAGAGTADQNTEREGPLAGFRGIIPIAPIGSAQRPKAISLKLQANEEQQTTAALIEQIIASESTAHPLKASSFVAAQRTLRWVLSGLFVVVLSAMLWINASLLPVFVSASQVAEIGNTSNLILAMPENAPVLVVIDYEPSLSGEMEAVAGPMLDQMAILRRLNFTFISTSPNGSVLAERLLAKTKINQSAPNGLGYQVNSQYFLAGYLPGGSAGVNGFIQNPRVVIPAVNISAFGDYAAVVLITDQAESGLTWIEQVELAKRSNTVPVSQPLLVAASAQAGPMLEPFVSSKQVTGMVSGMPDAVGYEHMNNSRPGIALSYWDAFSVGLALAIVAMVLGSLWSLFTGIRARRLREAEQG